MSDEPAAAAPAPSASTGKGAGAALLNERRRQGLSLGDISRQLKLSVRQVEALERDDYSAYKGPVFIHGFIRNYAKLLGLDPEPLIRATDSMLKPPNIQAPAERAPERLRVMPEKQNKLRLWPVAGAILLIGLALSVYLGGRRSPDAGRNPPSVAARDKPAPLKTPGGADTKGRKEATPDVESAKPVAKAPVKPETRSEPKTRTDPTPVRVPAEAGGTTSADTAGLVKVRMIFEQDSWVEIKDRSGNTIFGQLNPAGSRRSVSGAPPLSVVVGNAAGVRLYQGDKSIDLAPHTRVDVARLTLE
jgi:cytoskeleton protein RodZ